MVKDYERLMGRQRERDQKLSQTLLVLIGKLEEIIVILAKLNNMNLGELARLREKERDLADMGALDAAADQRETCPD